MVVMMMMIMVVVVGMMMICLFGFLTSSSTTGLYRGRAPRQERLTILRAATHETELGDHDFCLSRSHYTDTDPTCMMMMMMMNASKAQREVRGWGENLGRKK